MTRPKSKSRRKSTSPRRAKSHRILRWSGVRDRIRRSRVTIWRDVKAGRFPAPVQLGPNSVGWFEDEVDAWLAARPRRTYGAPAPEAT
jgi:prophage regulatory protein